MSRPRRLTEQDRPLIEEFLSDKLDIYVFVAEKLLGDVNNDALALGEVKDDTLHSMLFLSGNAVPISMDNHVAKLYVHTPYVRFAHIASIVGATNDVTAFWGALCDSDSSRKIASQRECQPYLLRDTLIDSTSNSLLEYIRPDCFEQFFEASYAMFVGEVGRAPLNLSAYKARLYDQVLNKRSLGHFDDEGILRFKVDVPIVYEDVCQIQGVWMHPEWRAQGRSTDLLSGALSIIQRDIALRVSLYVNDFNRPALSLYHRLGFEQIAEYSTIFLDM